MIRKPLSATRELAQLLKPFWPIVLVSILLGILGGFSVTTLLATINRALNSENGLTQGVMLAFAGLFLDKEGAFAPDYEDEILKAALVTQGGAVVHPNLKS